MSKEPEYMNAISGLIQYFVVGWETKQFDYEKAFNIVEQSLTELEELKKRDTAMKVIKDYKYFYDYDNGNNIDLQPSVAYEIYQCPHCFKRLNHGNYCPNCGQRLDWGEKDE